MMLADRGATIIDPAALPGAMLAFGGDHIVDWEFRPALNPYLAINFRSGAPASVAAILESGEFLPDYRTTLSRRASLGSLNSDTHRQILVAHTALATALTELLQRHVLDALVYPTSVVVPTSLENPRGGWGPELAARSGRPAVTLPGPAPRLISLAACNGQVGQDVINSYKLCLRGARGFLGATGDLLHRTPKFLSGGGCLGQTGGRFLGGRGNTFRELVEADRRRNRTRFRGCTRDRELRRQSARYDFRGLHQRHAASRAESPRTTLGAFLIYFTLFSALANSLPFRRRSAKRRLGNQSTRITPWGPASSIG